MKRVKLGTKFGAGMVIFLLIAVSVSATVTIDDTGLTTTSSDFNLDFDDNNMTVDNISAGNITISGDYTGGNVANWNTAYTERGSQIAGDNLSWSGGQLNAVGGADGFYDVTRIWNSNGNSWVSNGNNLQLALWDLNNTGGAVYLPNGIIELSKSLIWPSISGVTLRGLGIGYVTDNAGSTLKLGNNVNDDIIKMNTSTRIFFPMIRDLELDGNRANNNAGHGINITGNVTDILFDNLFIHHISEDGIYIKPAYTNFWNFWLDNCLVEYTDGNGFTVDGSGTYTVQNIFTQNMYFTYNDINLRMMEGKNVVISQGIFINSVKDSVKCDGDEGQSLRFIDCFFSSPNGNNIYDGISLDDQIYVYITQCIIVGDYKYGVYADNVNRLKISNCDFIVSGGTTQIYCHDGDDIQIHDNWFYGNRSIDLNHANVNYASFHDNNVRWPSDPPLFISDARVKNNVGYDYSSKETLPTLIPTSAVNGSIYLNNGVLTFYDGSTWQTSTGEGNASLDMIRNSNNNYWTVSESNLQNAINDTGDNGTIWLPSNYTVELNESIGIDGINNLTIYGYGFTLKAEDAYSGYFVDEEVILGIRYSNDTKIYGLTIDSNNASNQQPSMNLNGVKVFHSDNLVLEDMIFSNGVRDIGLSVGTKNVDLVNCRFYNFGSCGASSVYVSTVDAFRATNCHWETINGGTAQCMYLDGDSNSIYIIDGCTAKDIWYFADARYGYATITNCYVDGCKVAISTPIDDSPTYVTNCKFINVEGDPSNDASIRLTSGRTIISNCDIQGTGGPECGYGIKLTNDSDTGERSHDCIIENNNISGFSYAFYIIRSMGNHTIRNNIINGINYGFWSSDNNTFRSIYYDNIFLDCSSGIQRTLAPVDNLLYERTNLGNISFVPLGASNPYSYPRDGDMYFVTGNQTLAIYYNTGWYYFDHI